MARLLLSTNTAWNLPNFRAGVINALNADGHDIICAAPADGHVHRIEAMGCAFHDLPMDPQGTSPVKDFELLRRYRGILTSERVDAYLSWTPKPNIYGAMAARSLGIPAVINISGLGVAFGRSDLLEFIVSNLYRAANACASTVFFQNPDNLEHFRRRGLIGRTRVQLLPGSGVDLDRFAFSKPVASRKETVFLMVCRLLRQKGVEEFVSAARGLRRQGLPVEFRLAGMLDEQNAGGISRTELDVWVQAGDISYMGALDDVRPMMTDADCVVLPSYYPEGTPRSLLEAAALGRPIITTDTPGCRDVVVSGENGFLVPPRDAEGLAAAMAAFAKLTVGERLAMSKASRSICEAKFDERLVTQAYVLAVRSALA